MLPVEARVYFKRTVESPEPALAEYYNLLYASYNDEAVDETELELYETVPLDSNLPDGVDLGRETLDGSLWIALLIYVFSVRWKLLPPSGFVPFFEDPAANLRSMVLPSLALAVWLNGVYP